MEWLPTRLLQIIEKNRWLNKAQIADLSDRAADLSATGFWEQLSKPGWLEEKHLAALRFLAENQHSIPGYELVGFIGCGGMGAVFEARHLKLDRFVAVKTLRLDRQHATKAVERFYQEARTLARLQHPNIVTVYDFGEVHGHLYLTMELITGIDLDDLVTREGAQRELRVWKLMKQAAQGLLHACEKGIVHRDLKPANMLLSRAGEAEMELLKIVDFGLAFQQQPDVSDRLTESGTVLGSPRYMSPEQISGNEIDHASDVYGLGATAFHLLAGKPPYSGKSMSEIIAAKLTAQAPRIGDQCSNVSFASCELVAKLMAQLSQDRPQRMELINEIDQTIAALELQDPDNVQTLDLQTLNASTLSLDDGNNTLPVTKPRPLTNPAKVRRMLAIGAMMLGAMMLVVATLFGWNFFGTRPAERTKMVEVGSEHHLFNGTSLSGWNRRSGNWIAEANEAVIEGDGGVISRTIVSQNDDPKPLQFYRFTVLLDRHEAEFVEVHFGLSANELEENRHVLRLTQSEFQLGFAKSDQEGAFKLSETVETAISSFERSIAVQIERQPKGWFIAINEYPAAAVPLPSYAEIPVIRLAARRGIGWFSDVSVVELKPAN